MTRQARAAKRPAADLPLSRERILAAGQVLLAKQGAERLSMRALADELGTAPMSLYRHVRSKDEMLRAIVDAALERLDLDLPRRGAWTDQAAAWMHSLRQQLLRSPAVVSILMQHGHYAPALLRATDTLLRILREAGFGRREAVRAWREIMWSTLGFVSSEIRGPAFSPSFYTQALSASKRPTGKGQARGELGEVAAHLPYLAQRDLDEVFSAIVRHLLLGVAAELAAAPAQRRKVVGVRAASRGGRA